MDEVQAVDPGAANDAGARRADAKARARRWQKSHRALSAAGAAAMIVAMGVSLRVEFLTDVGNIGTGRGAALQAMLLAVPRVALAPAPGTPDAAVSMARWYLGWVGLAVLVWLAAGGAFLRANHWRLAARPARPPRHQQES